MPDVAFLTENSADETISAVLLFSYSGFLSKSSVSS